MSMSIKHIGAGKNRHYLIETQNGFRGAGSAIFEASYLILRHFLEAQKDGRSAIQMFDTKTLNRLQAICANMLTWINGGEHGLKEAGNILTQLAKILPFMWD